MNILHLNLKKKWFEMIARGEKREEYREIKPYWVSRIEGKDFEVIQFRNGYSKNAPTMTVELIDIRIGLGKPEWGGGSDSVFILQLGRIAK